MSFGKLMQISAAALAGLLIVLAIGGRLAAQVPNSRQVSGTENATSIWVGPHARSL